MLLTDIIICAFFFFLNWNIQNTTDSLTLTENHNKQSHTCCYKWGLHPSFGHFYKYKKVEMTPGELRGEKTRLIRRQLFKMCSREACSTCFSIDVGPLRRTVAICACASMSSLFNLLWWILTLVMQGEHWFGFTSLQILPFC